MTSYDVYVFILCLIVFTLLTAVFVCMLAIITKQSIRLIDAGTEDERIYEEYLKTKQSENNKKNPSGWLSAAFTVFFVCVFAVIFAFTLVVQLSKDQKTGDIPTLRVVYSESMSAKYERNEYLFENNLNDQFSRFDIVVTYKLPKEEELKLYDIVVYEVDGALLIHRIVGIEEPNENHPNERHFLLQGDLVERPDKFPVRYSQMKAIYRGEHLPFIGSFVMFLQSPAGYVCLILVLAEMIATPFIAKQIEKAEQTRLALLLKKREEEPESRQETQAEENSTAEQAEQSEQSVLLQNTLQERTTEEDREKNCAASLVGKKKIRIARIYFTTIRGGR